MLQLRRALALAAVAVVALASMARPSTTDASDWWCFDDPVIHINGQTIRLLAGVERSNRDTITSATFVVTVPANVDARAAVVTRSNAQLEVAGQTNATMSTALTLPRTMAVAVGRP